MLSKALTEPVVGVYTTGRVALPAFCTPSASLFAAPLRHQRRPRSFDVAAPASPYAIRSGEVQGRIRRRRGRSDLLRCGLTRLSEDAGHKVLPLLATRDQWSHYWGGSDVQRVGKFFEVTAVAFLGLWACYFASFFLGVATMTVIGTSFLFYWLLAPNVTSFRRNRALRGRIAPFPGAKGNSIAIFRARVASAREEYHPITGQPVFLRMVIEDEDGRALKFRTRTRREYARVRPGMIAEAILVSPDDRFDEILGVSDTFIPAANVWVGEYPYLDKVVMRRLLASRDLKRKRRQTEAATEEDLQVYEDSDYDMGGGLDPMPYRESWVQTQYQDEKPPEREADSPRMQQTAGWGRDAFDNATSMTDFAAYYGEDEDEEPYFEGVGSSGFAGVQREVDGSDGGVKAQVSTAATGRSGQRQQWERVSGRPRPRRQASVAASRRFREETEVGGDYFESGGRRGQGEASGWGGSGRTRYGAEGMREDSGMAGGRNKKR